MNETNKIQSESLAPDPALAGRQIPNREEMASYRPNYSPDNANKWREVFDKMIITRQNQVITTAASGFKPGTLYSKANDALKWLMDNDCFGPTEEDWLASRKKYAKLRGEVSVRKGVDRILIYFKPTLANMAAASEIRAVTETSIRKWKDEFETWLATAQPGEIFYRDNIAITLEQKIWITKLMAELGDSCEVEISATMDRIRVMR